MTKKILGAATLVITVILILVALLAMMYATKFSTSQQRTAANQYGATQALEAAQAGLDFGVQYLSANSAAVIATASSGSINYGPSNASLTNVTLSNNSKYSVVYTNPTANNYVLMQVTSTGTNADGTATRTVRELVYAGTSSLQYALSTQQNLITAGNANVSGTYGADIGGTYTQAGSSSISTIQQNDSTLSSMSNDDLVQTIFGVTPAQLQASSSYYSNPFSVNYSALSGKVWINGSVSLAGNTTIGTVASPVLLYIDGNLSIAGRVAINGLVFTTGSITTTGNTDVNGGLVAQGNIIMTGSSNVTSSSIINQFTANTFSRVPGSWRDF